MVHHVVRKAQGILGMEVLVILIDAVLVQPAGGSDPDMSVSILGEGVHPLVGEAVGHDDAFGRTGNGQFPFSAADGDGGGEEEGGYQSVIHRYRLESVCKYSHF